MKKRNKRRTKHNTKIVIVLKSLYKHSVQKLRLNSRRLFRNGLRSIFQIAMLLEATEL